MSEVAKPAAQETPNAAAAASPSPAPAPESKPEAKPAGAAAPEQNPEAGAAPKPEAKAPEAQKPVVPEKYDLKLREGSLLDASTVDKVASIAKERGLTNDQAQALLEQRDEAVATYAEAQKSELTKNTAKWADDAKVDPEFGGEAFNQNVELAHRVVKKFFPETVQKSLNESGLGNFPDLIRGFVRIGKQMHDDQLFMPPKQTGDRKSPADLLYPTTAEKEGA